MQRTDQDLPALDRSSSRQASLTSTSS